MLFLSVDRACCLHPLARLAFALDSTFTLSQFHPTPSHPDHLTSDAIVHGLQGSTRKKEKALCGPTRRTYSTISARVCNHERGKKKSEDKKAGKVQESPIGPTGRFKLDGGGSTVTSMYTTMGHTHPRWFMDNGHWPMGLFCSYPHVLSSLRLSFWSPMLRFF